MKRGHFLISLTGILSGLVTFGGKLFSDMGLSLFEVSLIPYLLSLLFLLPFMLSGNFRLNRGAAGTLALYGLVVSVLTLAEFAGVILGVPVAVAALLIYTQPLWTVLLGKFFLHERISRQNAAACLLVLIGVVVLVNPLTETFDILSLGVLISILAGILLSLWIILGRVSGLQGIHPIATQFWSGAFAAVFLIGLYIPLSYFVQDPAIMSFSFSLGIKWLYLIVFTLLLHILSHLSFFYGAREIPSNEAGIILLLEPVSAALLAFAFLGQPLGWNVLLGGILILFANYLVIRQTAGS